MCKKIDKICRKFIWGSSENPKKTYLIPWELVTKPKELDELGFRKTRLDELGFRKTRLVNNAFMLKIALGVVQTSNVL